MLKTETVRQIREFLNEVYNRTGKTEDLDSLTDDEILAMANNLKNDGVRLRLRSSTAPPKSRSA